MLCLRPLTHLVAHSDHRALIIGPEEQEAEARFSAFGIHWMVAHVVVIIFTSVLGRNIHSLKSFWDNGYYS